MEAARKLFILSNLLLVRFGPKRAIQSSEDHQDSALRIAGQFVFLDRSEASLMFRKILFGGGQAE